MAISTPTIRTVTLTHFLSRTVKLCGTAKPAAAFACAVCAAEEASPFCAVCAAICAARSGSV